VWFDSIVFDVRVLGVQIAASFMAADYSNSSDRLLNGIAVKFALASTDYDAL
jgi:hypothetical protein